MRDMRRLRHPMGRGGLSGSWLGRDPLDQNADLLELREELVLESLHFLRHALHLSHDRLAAFLERARERGGIFLRLTLLELAHLALEGADPSHHGFAILELLG